MDRLELGVPGQIMPPADAAWHDHLRVDDVAAAEDPRVPLPVA